MIILRTITRVLREDKEGFKVPKKVQDIIPIEKIYEDGIFKVGKNKYSKSFKFEDINYRVASDEDKVSMFLQYSEILKSLDSSATTKLTINNRRINKVAFKDEVLIDMKEDLLDEYRKEYNEILFEKATGSNSIIQEKYFTISIIRNSLEEARSFFRRISADLAMRFSRMGSLCKELTTDERLKIAYA